MAFFTSRYVGGEADGGHVVRDSWTGKNIEKHKDKAHAMKRVVEANKPYIDAEINVHGKRRGS